MATECGKREKRARAFRENPLKDNPEEREHVPGFMLTMSGNICWRGKQAASFVLWFSLHFSLFIDFSFCFHFDLGLEKGKRCREWVADGFLGQLLSGCLFHPSVGVCWRHFFGGSPHKTAGIQLEKGSQYASPFHTSHTLNQLRTWP